MEKNKIKLFPGHEGKKWKQSTNARKVHRDTNARKLHRVTNARKVRRALGVLMAVAVAFQTMPFGGIAVSAAESSGIGLCEHHTEHTADCGYKEAEPGTECTHEHTEDCYITTEEGGSILECHHEHDERCGYSKGTPGSPCAFVCKICNDETPENNADEDETPENNADEDETPENNADENEINDGESENPEEENEDKADEPDNGQEECVCEELCKEGSVNTDCPVCGAGEARVSDCKGKDTEESTEKQSDTADGNPADNLEGIRYLDWDEDQKGLVEKTCAGEVREVNSDTATWSAGWYLVNENVTMAGSISVNGEVHLILADDCKLTAEGGVNVERENGLTIYAQSEGSSRGQLSATGSDDSAGIGSGRYEAGGTITINGGGVTATGKYGAGIGGGWQGASGTITINGGEVTANGGMYGAGIGGGWQGAGGTITINGGKVTANGGTYGAGIGGGWQGAGGTITINGGEVTANGGTYGAGIGGGYKGAGGTITITNAKITAKGDSNAENIGHGFENSDSGTRYIQNSTVNGVQYYVVTFNTGEHSEVKIPTQSLANGETAAEPSGIEIEGYIISGWYTDEGCTTKFNFDSKITGDTALYAKWEENKEYIATVTIGSTPENYTTLATAWSSLEGQTGAIRLLKSVDTSEILTVSSGMEVTVEMADDVTFTNTSQDCFQVKGGSLTLTGSCTVIEKGSGKSIVYAESGTLRVTGGDYTSTAGNGFWIDKGVDVKFSGGTIHTDSDKTALRYQSPRTVAELLDSDYALWVDNSRLPISSLNGERLSTSGACTVDKCNHSDGDFAYASNNDGTHSVRCQYCGSGKGDAEQHTWGTDGLCTGCKVQAAASVTVDGTTGHYANIDSAWNAAQRAESATLRLLASVPLTNGALELTSGNVTLEMAEDVVLSSGSSGVICVNGGTLKLNSGTVKCTSGYSALLVKDGILIMNGGKVTGASGVETNGGRAEVHGGEIYGNAGYVAYAFENNGGVVGLSGGVYYGYYDSIYCSNGKMSQMLAEGYAFHQDDMPMTVPDGTREISGRITVEKCGHGTDTKYLMTPTAHTPVCSACGTATGDSQAHDGSPCSVCEYYPRVQVNAGGSTGTYSTIEDAWKAATADGVTEAVITLLSDVTSKTTLGLTGGNITLNSKTDEKGNAYTISVSNAEFAIHVEEDGVLTVESGAVKSTGEYSRGICAKYGGKVIIKGSANIMAQGEHGRGICAEHNGKVTIKGSANITAEGDYSSGVYINGGTVIIAGSTEITAAGAHSDGVSVYDTFGLDISGGTITASGSDSKGLYIYDLGVTLTGGTFHGDGSAIYIKNSGYGPLGALLGSENYYYDEEGKKRIDDTAQLAGLSLTGTITVKTCLHEFGADKVCTLCGYHPVVEVGAGGNTRQYASMEDAWKAATADGVTQAVITLLDDVSGKSGYSSLVLEKGNSVTLKSPRDKRFRISNYIFGIGGGTLNAENCIISVENNFYAVYIESGKGGFTNCTITGRYLGVMAAGGTLTISGGTVTGGKLGVGIAGGEVTINNGAEITATGDYNSMPAAIGEIDTYAGKDGEEDVFGLHILGGTVTLKDSKFSGKDGAVMIAQREEAPDGKKLVLGSLLGHTDKIRYAYYDKDDKLITGRLEETGLANPYTTVTVKECEHEKASSNGNGTHKLDCSACGFSGEMGCHYTFAEGSNTAVCAYCGSEIVITVNGAGLTYDGTAKTPEITVKLDGAAIPAGEYDITYFNSNGGAGNLTNAGTVTVTVTAGADGRYTGSYSTTFSIAPREVTPGIAGTAVKTYDGANTAPAGLSVTLTDVVEGDDVTATAAACTYDGVNAGIHTVTVEGITLGGADAGNYILSKTSAVTTGEITKAEHAPDMPPAVMDNVSKDYQKVGDVPLPEGWAWRDADRETALEVGMPVTAVAVYTGADKGNYENETVTVTITRSSCEHTAGDILYTGTSDKAPTCTEEGIGHTECTKCHVVIQTGIVAPALGHDYDAGEITKAPTLESEGEKTYTCKRCGHTYTEAVPKITSQELWIDNLEPFVTYTGSALKQEDIRVYYGETPLRENVDYTISYKNNTNAGTAQIVVTGKGNYTGKAVKTFTIEPTDISADLRITAIVTTAVETGKTLKPRVVVTWNGKKLKEKTDYTLSYNADIKTAGDYDITITGKQNYTGTIGKAFHVKPRGTKLLNSAKVTGLARSYPYQSGRLESDLQNITVKIGKTMLEKDTDYMVRTENTDIAGTADIIIEASPTSAYAGEKHIAVTITGTDLKKGSIKGVEKSYPYTGAPVTPQITVYSGKNGSGEMIPADAYTISYSGNINKGKATVTATGRPEKGYSGSIKASYQIGTLNLETEKAAGNIKVTMPADISHAKGGAKPQPVITHIYNGTTRTLREGADYTLKYSNNTIAAGTKTPEVRITGTGNYSGSITETYAISAQDISKLSVTVTDKAYGKNKKGSYYCSAPKVYDLDGKQLKPGKDYTVQYTYADSGQPIGKNDKIAAGTKLCATVTAVTTSSYTGTQSMAYFVREAKEVKDIAKARNDKIAPQQYTGREITPEIKLYIKTGKTKTYLTAEDYEVIGCYNNTKRGTANVLVRGRGSYSGVKRITFKIVQKKIK